MAKWVGVVDRRDEQKRMICSTRGLCTTMGDIHLCKGLSLELVNL